MKTFIHQILKAELNGHIEGSLEPELLFELVVKNGVHIPLKTV